MVSNKQKKREISIFLVKRGASCNQTQAQTRKGLERRRLPSYWEQS